MCIIISKESGIKMPKDSIFETCFNRNPDGAGMMYPEKGKVRIEKGFMTLKSFQDRLDELGKQKDLRHIPMVFHFRISTSGNVDAGNCHPYPLSGDLQDLRSLDTYTDLGIAHNGIIQKYNSYTSKAIENDTQTFIMGEIVEFSKLNKEFYKSEKVMEMISDLTDSRMIFLDPKGDIAYSGTWVTDKGVKYSNSTYLGRVSNFTNYNDYWDYTPKKKKTKKVTPLMPLDDYFLENCMPRTGNYIMDSTGDCLEVFDYDEFYVDLDTEQNSSEFGSYTYSIYVKSPTYDSYLLYDTECVILTKQELSEYLADNMTEEAMAETEVKA